MQERAGLRRFAKQYTHHTSRPTFDDTSPPRLLRRIVRGPFLPRPPWPPSLRDPDACGVRGACLHVISLVISRGDACRGTSRDTLREPNPFSVPSRCNSRDVNRRSCMRRRVRTVVVNRAKISADCPWRLCVSANHREDFARETMIHYDRVCK